MISHIKAPAVSGSLCGSADEKQTASLLGLKMPTNLGEHRTRRNTVRENQQTLCTHRITTDQDIGERRAEAEL